MNFSYKKLLVGLLFSGFFFLSIYWISNDFSGIWEVSKNADYFMVFIGLLFYSFSLLFRSFRWNYLLKNNSSKLSTRKLTPIVIVGYMFINLLIRTYFHKLSHTKDVGKGIHLTNFSIKNKSVWHYEMN